MPLTGYSNPIMGYSNAIIGHSNAIMGYSNAVTGYSNAFYGSKLWMWNLATVTAWSNLIHVTLWGNDGFLQSFFNLSKINAFSKNLIKTKFIYKSSLLCVI